MIANDVLSYSIPFLSLTGDNETRYAFPVAPPLSQIPPLIPKTSQFFSYSIPVIVCLAAVILVHSVWSSHQSLSAFNGPKLAALSNWWYWRQLTGGKQHVVFKKASDDFGMVSVDFELEFAY